MALNSHPKSDSSDSTSRDEYNGSNPADSAQPKEAKLRPKASAGTARDEVQFTSVRIGDIDRPQRTAAPRSRFSRILYVILGILAFLIAVLGIALIVLSRTSALDIENIEINGNEHLTVEEISQLVTIPQGTTLLDVDADGIKANLERDAWIKSVDIHRVFPSTLEITITERQIVAVVEVPIDVAQTIQSWAIASDGMWLMAIPSQDSEVGQSISAQIYEDAANVLWITDVPYGVTPTIGAYCTDDNINNALAIVSDMTTDLADQVKTVSATDAESTLLTLDSGIEIAFGLAENVREKERICLEIIEENPTVVYINVRVVDRPTWRAA